MSNQPGQEEDFGAVCPYLGLADDADSHATYATDAHRCYRLPNPTRIATHHQETYCLGPNHTTCPVYVGDETPGVPRAAGAGAAPAPVSPPLAASRGGARRQSPTAQMPRPRRTPGGTLGPRPRSGGISMPVATIGLFALAIVVVAIAFGITQLTNNGGNKTNNLGGLTGQTATATVPAQTTTVAAGGSATAPAGSTTPNASATASTTASGGGGTYTVVSGDNCSGIAAANGITLDQLYAANGGANGKCANLNPGDVLTIP
ncbi:MAG TPA: LysM peptidoglycan-binding domain-containing protein [Tepidiformaceae bacterium]|nr:LysM peptidoglycan-binding domain-containing protein [Tepidiformaceae bacterium]